VSISDAYLAAGQHHEGGGGVVVVVLSGKLLIDDVRHLDAPRIFINEMGAWDRVRNDCGDGVRRGRGARLAGREADEDACVGAADFESSVLIRTGDHWSRHDGAHVDVTKYKTADYESDICTVRIIVNVWAFGWLEKEFQVFFRSVPRNFQGGKSLEKFFGFRVIDDLLSNTVKTGETVTFITSKFNEFISDINHSCPAQQRSTHQSCIRRLCTCFKDISPLRLALPNRDRDATIHMFPERMNLIPVP
jgi:hypothetical protein